MATGLAKNKALIMVFVYLQNTVVRISRNLAKKLDQIPRERSITKNLNFDIGNF